MRIVIKQFYFFFLVIFILSCKSTTEPIVYDKNIDLIKKEAQVIHLLIANENYVDANKEFEKDLRLYPDNPELLLLKAYLLLYEKNYDECEKQFKRVLEKNKANPLAYLGLARLYRLNSKFDLAKENIKIGLSYSKFISYLWLESGIIDYEEANYKEALVKFTKAYNLDMKNQDALFFKYITMLKVGRELEEIKSVWENLIKTKKLKSFYYLYHADVLYKLNLKDFSINVLKTGLDDFPNDPYLLNFYAYALYEKYKLIKAENLSAEKEEEIEINKIKDSNANTASDLSDDLSIKEEKQNKKAEKKKLEEMLITNALNAINKCINNQKSIEVEFIDTYFLILEEKGDFEKLKEQLNRYLYIFPDSQIIKSWIKRYN